MLAEYKDAVCSGSDVGCVFPFSDLVWYGHQGRLAPGTLNELFQFWYPPAVQHLTASGKQGWLSDNQNVVRILEVGSKSLRYKKKPWLCFS